MHPLLGEPSDWGHDYHRFTNPLLAFGHAVDLMTKGKRHTILVGMLSAMQKSGM